MNQIMRDLLQRARHDQALKKALLDSRKEAEAYAAFCRVATEAGFPMTVEELMGYGQEYSDNMLKSCNGGATYPFEYLDDMYGMFFAALE